MSIINGRMNDEIDQLDIKEIKIQEFEFQVKVSFVSIMKTWGLLIHTPTPEFEAIRQFMGERYKIFETDTHHAPFFSK